MKIFFKLIKFIFICIFIVGLSGAAVAFYTFFVEPNRVVTETINIVDEEVSEDTSIVLFADTHFKKDYTAEDFKKAVTEINSLNPDIVIFLGDLFDDYSTYTGDPILISNELSNIKASIGKYAVFGNHDYGGSAENEYRTIMKNGGFQVLVNESISFDERNITLTGIDDFLLGYGDTKVIDAANINDYNIIACHEPDIIDSIIDKPVDLMVSAHTHGGQLQIPLYKEDLYLPPLGKKYVEGKYTFNNSSQSLLYVNRGLGTTNFTARFLSVPEITLIKLSNK